MNPSPALVEQVRRELECVRWKTIVHPNAPDPKNWHETVPNFQALAEKVAGWLEPMKEALNLCDPKGDRARVIHAPEDADIEWLCEQIGYGAVMDAAARLWRLKDPIGAHTIGPCAQTVRDALAALGAEKE